MFLAGYAMQTHFEVACASWLDEGDNIRREDSGDVTSIQLKYLVGREGSAGAGDAAYLMQSTTPSMGPLMLPAGDQADGYVVKLVVAISDKYDSFTETSIAVKVSSCGSYLVATLFSFCLFTHVSISLFPPCGGHCLPSGQDY